MAKSPELVKPFLADLSEKLDSAAHKELAVLQGLKEKELQELGKVRTLYVSMQRREGLVMTSVSCFFGVYRRERAPRFLVMISATITTRT